MFAYSRLLEDYDEDDKGGANDDHNATDIPAEATIVEIGEATENEANNKDNDDSSKFDNHLNADGIVPYGGSILLTVVCAARRRIRKRRAESARRTASTGMSGAGRASAVVYPHNSISEPTVVGAGGGLMPKLSELSEIVDECGRITVMCFTWNLASESKRSLQQLSTVFTKMPPEERPCVISIALQELSPSVIRFHTNVIDVLGAALGGTHYVYCWVRKWSQMLLIFVKKPLCAFASRPEYKFIATNALAKPIRTKGAIGIAFRLLQTSCVFIACHLTHGKLKNRILDYHKISRSFDFECFRRMGGDRAAAVHSHLRDGANAAATSSRETAASRRRSLADNLAAFERPARVAALPFQRAAQIFWFGDLNFRVRKCAATAEAAARMDSRLFRREADFCALLEHDELRAEQRNGFAFEDFQEGVIRFPPTHKFIAGTNKYAKHRIPSYTDRVLYWSRDAGTLIPIRYDCLWDVTTSDHKPVYCTFKMDAVDAGALRLLMQDRLNNANRL